ncbi:MAG: hypothetical protein KAG26_08025, partial [Methylococcales bacterium]|nr:hypothetical protein [Methylococcales bacterium]
INLTREGDMVGSPGYMSPEQAQANKNIDHRCDIYSVGVIFSEMLLGKNKFAADSYIETSMNHIQMEIPHLDTNLSQYQGILDKMLAKFPHERFSSAKAVSRALDEVNRGDEEAVDLSTVKMPKRSFLARFDTVVFVFILMTILGGGAYFFQQTMVETHLEKAGQAYKKNKLLVPKGDNAVYHYRKTLNFEPWNTSAQKGLEKVADRYATWAEKSLKKRHFKSARKYLNKGLKADPNNLRLKAVEKRLK